MLSLLENREPEVRQITVMFCDLVGSTELSEKMDPEDLRILIDAYRRVCGAAVTRYEGQVALTSRVGICSGRVVVGQTGTSFRSDYRKGGWCTAVHRGTHNQHH
jgi:class 3 adenylate cyclase